MGRECPWQVRGTDLVISAVEMVVSTGESFVGRCQEGERTKRHTVGTGRMS